LYVFRIQDKPFVIGMIDRTTSKVHILVAMGYLYNFPSKSVLFYDPNGFYKAFDYDVATYYVNGETHTWEATIY